MEAKAMARDAQEDDLDAFWSSSWPNSMTHTTIFLAKFFVAFSTKELGILCKKFAKFFISQNTRII
jgi:hypothetical protein